MQGRLVNSEKRNYIQYFPSKNWIKEFYIANNIKIKFIEWVANYENIKLNPILYKSGIKKINKYKKKYNIKIRSIDMQFIINKPFFKSKGVEFSRRLNLLKKIILNTQKIGIKFVILPILENSSLKYITEENLFIKRSSSPLLSNKSKSSPAIAIYFPNGPYSTCPLLFPCSSSAKHCSENKVICNSKHHIRKYLRDPLQITMVKNNVVGCEIDYNEEENTYNDIDMKLLNISNQNIIFFN